MKPGDKVVYHDGKDDYPAKIIDTGGGKLGFLFPDGVIFEFDPEREQEGVEWDFDDFEDGGVDDVGPLPSTPQAKPSKPSKSPLKQTKSLPAGSIKMFKKDGGFGFIRRDDEQPDLFFHVTEVHNQDVVAVGARVEWASEGANAKGPYAEKVRVIEGATQTPLDHSKVRRKASSAPPPALTARLPCRLRSALNTPFSSLSPICLGAGNQGGCRLRVPQVLLQAVHRRQRA